MRTDAYMSWRGKQTRRPVNEKEIFMFEIVVGGFYVAIGVLYVCHHLGFI